MLLLLIMLSFRLVTCFIVLCKVLSFINVIEFIFYFFLIIFFLIQLD